MNKPPFDGFMFNIFGVRTPSSPKKKKAITYQKSKNMNKLAINKNNKRVHLLNTKNEDIHDELPTSIYNVVEEDTLFGTIFHISQTKIKLPTSAYAVAEKIVDLEYLDILFSKENAEICAAMNIKRKAGYLLHGIQGSGKTTTLQAMAMMVKKRFDGSIFIVESLDELTFILNFIKDVRELEDFIACIIFDECEWTLQHKENEMKVILDGYDSPDNTVFLFSTNYIDDIPDTIKDRPSRFKYVLDVGVMGEEDIVYNILSAMNDTLPKKYKLTNKVLKSLAPKGTGQTFDVIKNIFNDACFETVKALRIEAKIKKEISVA